MSTVLRESELAAARRDRFSPAEWQLRVDLAAAYRLIAR